MAIFRFFTAHNKGVQIGAKATASRYHLLYPVVPEGGGHIYNGDFLFTQEGDKSDIGYPNMGRPQNQRCTGGQRGENIGDRGIKCDGGKLQDTIPQLWFTGLMLGMDKVHHITVLQHHAFGLSGGAGSIDNIGQMMGFKWHIRIMYRLLCHLISLRFIIQQPDGQVC
ncbi:hypothetical protein Xedl_03901 [Xenorhabdus eapokensis]|uniref:Uncharacterized protein n=1 Tax=Xenorhabdus eapokensis TaxID=1873482 RepID=A0A1Q5TBY0_9GAMM|nr:hypothetical protein Xedl_03901 [Xenorhabdus eapokensis]